MVSKQKTVMIAVVTAVVVMVLSITGTLLVSEYQAVYNGDRNILSREDYATWLQYQQLTKVSKTIHENYYGEIDDQQLLTNAIKGYVQGLGDPYSYYFTPEEYEQYNQDIEGVYYGVGLLVNVDPDDGLVTIAKVYENTPAAGAGVQMRDKIIGVDDVNVTTYKMENIVALLRGEAGTPVTLHVRRGTEELSFEMQRAEITVNRAESRMIGDNIGYIQLHEFSGNGQELTLQAFRTLKKQGAKGFVLDLRDNPGGALDQAQALADELVPKGPTVNFRDNKGNKTSLNSDAKALDMPLVLLINENSASASELLAGCVKDYEVGTLVGTNTFGKGIVQSLMSINGASALKITTQQFFTPNGHTIHGVGIAPDVEIDLPQELKDNPSLITPENDVQLIKGLEILREKMAEVQ